MHILGGHYTVYLSYFECSALELHLSLSREQIHTCQPLAAHGEVHINGRAKHLCLGAAVKLLGDLMPIDYSQAP